MMLQLPSAVDAALLLSWAGRRSQRSCSLTHSSGLGIFKDEATHVRETISPHTLLRSFALFPLPLQSLNLRAHSNSEMEEWISAIMSPLAELAKPTEPFRVPQ